MNLVATRWWSMFFMPSCLLMLGMAVGAAWCLRAWRRGKTPRQAWPASFRLAIIACSIAEGLSITAGIEASEDVLHGVSSSQILGIDQCEFQQPSI
jgi:hypothetical protein